MESTRIEPVPDNSAARVNRVGADRGPGERRPGSRERRRRSRDDRRDPARPVTSTRELYIGDDDTEDDEGTVSVLI